MDVEEGDIVIQNVKVFTVVDWNQVDAVTDEAVEFVLQGQLAEGVDGGYQAVMAVNLEISVIFAIFLCGWQ